MRLLIVLLPLLLGRSQGVAPANSKELDPKTRPFLELTPFKKLPCVTVSEYRIPPPDGDNHAVRVYRFTYPAKFEAEVKRWRQLFPSKEGWTVDESTPTSVIMSRKVKHPKIKEQALLMYSGRFVFDASVRARTRVVPSTNYVRVSFNEVMKE
ncbi:MAG: hypothetical protein M9921_12875 [Fimbriimonadaceae bacterium]|nr:hypothetical protein [Fimbriimonadaceae bacterium]